MHVSSSLYECCPSLMRNWVSPDAHGRTNQPIASPSLIILLMKARIPWLSKVFCRQGWIVKEQFYMYLKFKRSVQAIWELTTERIDCRMTSVEPAKSRLKSYHMDHLITLGQLLISRLVRPCWAGWTTKFLSFPHSSQSKTKLITVNGMEYSSKEFVVGQWYK